MKKTLLLIVLAILLATTVNAQFKIHSSGLISFQSTTSSGGVQIESSGKSSFEPNITASGSPLTQTKVQNQLVKAWNVKYNGYPMIAPQDRFYVTGIGDAYANGHYTISSGGSGDNKGLYPIENATGLLSSLNGYYYDNDMFAGYKPDFIDNPNVLPEAVEGLMKDLDVNKSLGLSADDLEAVLPEAIRHDPEGMVYINYSALVPVLVDAFKEQQKTIELLQLEITDLKNSDS